MGDPGLDRKGKSEAGESCVFTLRFRKGSRGLFGMTLPAIPCTLGLGWTGPRVDVAGDPYCSLTSGVPKLFPTPTPDEPPVGWGGGRASTASEATGARGGEFCPRPLGLGPNSPVGSSARAPPLPPSHEALPRSPSSSAGASVRPGRLQGPIPEQIRGCDPSHQRPDRLPRAASPDRVGRGFPPADGRPLGGHPPTPPSSPSILAHLGGRASPQPRPTPSSSPDPQCDASIPPRRMAAGAPGTELPVASRPAPRL